MMIVQEEYMVRPDGVRLMRTYSDENVKIRQIETDIIYDEAIDTEPVRYTYEETDIPIDISEETDVSIDIPDDN